MSETPIPRAGVDAAGSIDPARLERALRRLPFLDREAFLMKARDGLSYAAIGVVLGLTAKAAEACVVAALIKLDVWLARMERPWWRFW